MPLVNDTATLYDAQVAAEMPGRLVRMMDLSGADYGMGPLSVLYSELASFVAGGAINDTIQYMKLPPGTLILGGMIYWEDGLSATDNALGDLGIIYEDGDGTDDPDALCDGLDIYDGATAPVAGAALPAGSWHHIGQDMAVFPYKVTGGWGTVTLINLTDDIVTAKDTKVMLYVILPA